MARLCLVVLALCIIGSTSAAPKFPTERLETLVNNALNNAIQHFSQKLEGKNLGDYNGNVKNVKFGLTDNKVTSFRIGKIDIGFSSKFKVDLSGFGLRFGGNWYYSYKKGFLKLSDKGTYKTGLDGLKFKLDVRADVNDHLAVHLNQESCDADLSGLDLDLKGGTAWVYNLFLGKLTKDIRMKFGNELCQNLGEEIAKESANL